MGLFDDAAGGGGAPPAEKEFAEAFARLAAELDPSSRNPQKNKALEQLIAQRTGWRSVSVKYIGDENNLTNRIGEAGKKSDASRYVVVLVPKRIIEPALRTAERLVLHGNWDFIGIGTRERTPPAIMHLIYAKDVVLPDTLLAAFPNADRHEMPTAADTVDFAPASDTAMHKPAEYLIGRCARDTGIPEERLATWLRRLERKKHLVFQGPPGTGKTFLAKRLARVLVSGTFGGVQLVQFHPSMTYEDFVQGIRATVEGGQVHYAVEPGRFLQFCEDARAMPGARFVLIIDELNRGNLSRIFGELLYLLEYRNESIPLAHGEEPFSVPDNVYLLATMNTADRSIALVDHAFRRRFSFVFLAPDYGHLSDWLLERGMNDRGQLVAVLERINLRIEDRNYHLGTSFFLTPDVELTSCLSEIWQGEIEPYLDEYFFDEPGKVDEFRWVHLADSDLSWWAEAEKRRSGDQASGHSSTKG